MHASIWCVFRKFKKARIVSFSQYEQFGNVQKLKSNVLEKSHMLPYSKKYFSV